MTAVGQRSSAGGRSPGMSIGAVIDRLRPDFPDITISKIRFLEAEGLISPERSASGYRRFSVEDTERLRFVLTAQRDQYLPLKVIKEQLDQLDAGAGAAGSPIRRLQPAGSRGPELVGAGAEDFRSDGRANREVRMSRADLISRAGVDERFLAELVRAGLIAPGQAGYFAPDCLQIVAAAKAMSSFGLEVRHLRGFKLAADREVGLIAQIAGPIALSRDTNARGRAEEITRELAALSVSLHAALVRSTMRGILDR